MIHRMKLHAQPFAMIRSGQKTIELRLYDEKRRRIGVGDTLLFTCSDYADVTLVTLVKGLHVFPDFAALYASLPLEQCGYWPEELAQASPEDMNAYYTQEQQARYGVLGIELQLLEETKP